MKLTKGGYFANGVQREPRTFPIHFDVSFHLRSDLDGIEDQPQLAIRLGVPNPAWAEPGDPHPEIGLILTNAEWLELIEDLQKQLATAERLLREDLESDL